MKKIKEFFMRKLRQRQLKKLHDQIICGSIFLRIINDELKRVDRHKRRRLIGDMMRNGRISDELVNMCEMKADYLIKAMQGQLKVYKKRKQDAKKQNKKKTNKATIGAEEVKSKVRVQPDETRIDNKPVDGAKYYEELKKKEAEGKLPEQKTKN